MFKSCDHAADHPHLLIIFFAEIGARRTGPYSRASPPRSPRPENAPGGRAFQNAVQSRHPDLASKNLPGYMRLAPGMNTISTRSFFSSADPSRSVRGYFLKSSFGPNWRGLTKMDATTTSFSRRARRTKDACPACSAPIVGTNPTDQPLPLRRSGPAPAWLRTDSNNFHGNTFLKNSTRRFSNSSLATIQGSP